MPPTNKSQPGNHPTIAVLGAGPGLGQAVARRWAREGYSVALVARDAKRLEALSENLRQDGAQVTPIIADLSDTAEIPNLAAKIFEQVGTVQTLYYAPTPPVGFIAATEISPAQVMAPMPLILGSLIAMVNEVLPHMVTQGDGAILTAMGGTGYAGRAFMSGPGPAQAAQRNYLQSLHLELADRGIFVGSLFIDGLIEHSAIHSLIEATKPTSSTAPTIPSISPYDLADTLWQMATNRDTFEGRCPQSE